MSENIQNIIEKILNRQVVSSIIIVIINFLIYKFIYIFLTQSEKKGESKLFAGKRGKTYIKLTKSIIRYVFIIVTVLIILKVNGVDVSSALTGVGLVGVIFGLAIQDWLKDIIRGSSIISDNYFSVGDIIKYKDIEGKVLVIGLKTTKIQDLKNNNVISIANRNIEEVEVVSNIVHIEVPMPYELPISKAEKAIDNIIELVKKNDNVNNCKYVGVTELGSSSINYLLEIDCNQHFKRQVKRDALRSVLIGLENNKIEVPYTQIDIHNK